MMDEKSAYGTNGEQRDTGEPTARDLNPDNVRPEHEKGVGEILEETRNNDAGQLQSGGMGRDHTPNDGTTQGAWHHDDQRQNERVQKVPQNEKDTDQIPD